MITLRFAADGTPCCCEYDTHGTPIPHRDPSHACAACQAHFAAQEIRTATEFPAPDIYSAPIAAIRAASATSPTFEDGWREKRTRELAAQRDRMAAHAAAHPSTPRLTAAEVRTYAPPDPYAADLAKMRKENR